MKNQERIILESHKLQLKARLKETFTEAEKEEIKELIMRIDCELEVEE